MYNLQEVEPCKLKVHFEAPIEKVQATRKEVLNSLRKGKIAGFRPGKAPDQVIEMKMKSQIDEWVKAELVRKSYDDFLLEEDIKVIGSPQVENAQLNKDDFWCEMVIYKKPSFELKQYKGFEIPEPKQAYSSQDLLHKTMEDLRTRAGDSQPYEENDFVQMGDKVTMALDVFDGDQKSEDLSREGFLYTLGTNLYPGMDDNLLGMNPGEERVFFLDINEKNMQISAKVHMGLRVHPAPLDDTLAKKYGVETYQELEKQITGMAHQRVSELRHQALQQQILKRLLAEHIFQVPEWYSKLEAQYLAGQEGKKFDLLPAEEQDQYLAAAVEAVRVALILDSVRDQEPESVFSYNELIQLLQGKIASQGQDPQQFISQAEKNGTLLGMLAKVKNDLTLNWLVKNCTVVE